MTRIDLVEHGLPFGRFELRASGRAVRVQFLAMGHRIASTVDVDLPPGIARVMAEALAAYAAQVETLATGRSAA